MADIKISQLGAAIAVGDTDLLPIVSGGNTLKATAAQVKEHSIGNTNISSLGDGSVTGAISALNTDKQPKTLDTPLTIGGVSKTTVEAALGGLVSENQTLTNNMAYINTSSTTASYPYKKGDFFTLGGQLCEAITDIANGATLTVNTNYKVDNNGGFNVLSAGKQNRFVNTLISSGSSSYLYIPFSSLPSFSALGTVELALVSYNGGAYNDLRAKFLVKIESGTPTTVTVMFRDVSTINCIIDTTNSRLACEGLGWYTTAFLKETVLGDY